MATCAQRVAACAGSRRTAWLRRGASCPVHGCDSPSHCSTASGRQDGQRPCEARPSRARVVASSCGMARQRVDPMGRAWAWGRPNLAHQAQMTTSGVTGVTTDAGRTGWVTCPPRSIASCGAPPAWGVFVKACRGIPCCLFRREDVEFPSLTARRSPKWMPRAVVIPCASLRGKGATGPQPCAGYGAPVSVRGRLEMRKEPRDWRTGR